MRKILDVTDTRTRAVQMAMTAGVGLLGGVAAVFIGRDPGSAVGWVVAASGVGLLALVAGVKQRWAVEYRGHRIAFENNAVTGERLYLDGGLVARGGVGTKMELRAPIRVGDGAGETIVALVDAKARSFRLRLFAEAPEDAAPLAGPAPTATLVEAPPAAEAGPVAATTTLGGFAVAKQTVEFLAAIFGLVGGLVAIVGALS